MSSTSAADAWATSRIAGLYEAYSKHPINCCDADEQYRRLDEIGKSLSKADSELIESQAQKGNPEAMCLMAAATLEGWRGRKDREKAVAWFRKAADAGNGMALDVLGGFYHDGAAPDLGFTRNRQEAMRLFRLAAERGFAKSQSTLGALLSDSQATAAEGFEWTRQAAEAGLWRAMFNLGLAYEKGEGVEPDRNAAIQWYRHAARHGIPGAAAKLRKLQPSWWQRLAALIRKERSS